MNIFQACGHSSQKKDEVEVSNKLIPIKKVEVDGKEKPTDTKEKTNNEVTKENESKKTEKEILRESLSQRSTTRVDVLIKQLERYRNCMKTARSSYLYNHYKKTYQRLITGYLAGREDKDKVLKSLMDDLPEMPKNVVNYHHYPYYSQYTDASTRNMFNEIKVEMGEIKKQLVKLAEEESKCEDKKKED